MRNLIFAFILSLICQGAFGQKDSIVGRDELLFEKALLLQNLIDKELYLDDVIAENDTNVNTKESIVEIKETIQEKAIELYQELIDSFPRSCLVPRALNNKGFTELSIKNINAAKLSFQKIIESSADDMENGGIGDGIMAEPFTNYKNRASKILAEICIEEEKFKEAISYLDLTQKFPYRHFCGNEYAADRLNMCILYAKCFVGLKDTSKALKVLLPKLLDDDFADNSAVVYLTTEILLKKYSKDRLRTLYEKAFKSYKVKDVKREKSYADKVYYIKFLGVNIEFNYWEFSTLLEEDEEIKIDKICKTSKFFDMLK